MKNKPGGRGLEVGSGGIEVGGAQAWAELRGPDLLTTPLPKPRHVVRV